MNLPVLESWSDSLLGKTHLPTQPASTSEQAVQPQADLYPKPSPACDEKEFLRTVDRHEIIVLRDDGVNRHLKFAAPYQKQEEGKPTQYDSNRWFELLTWPGKLCISGDMGTFVFTRLPDMFEFFRADRFERKPDRTLFINPGYWKQKCIAADGDGDSIEKWNAEYFKYRVWSWMEESSATEEDRQEVIDDVISCADDGEWRAMTAAVDFKSESGYQLYGFWEADCKVYAYHYLWCCYAIAWGVQRYDEYKQSVSAFAGQGVE